MAKRRPSFLIGIDRRGSSAATPPVSAFGTIVVSGQDSVVADELGDTLTLVAGANVVLTTNATNDAITIASTGGGEGGLADGDYGDVTVSGTGTVITINEDAVELSMLVDIATDSFLGRDTAGTGNVEVLSVATVKTLLGLTGTNSGDQNLFSTIAVSGQSNVVADSTTDTLTLAAGNNITITTNASTDTVTVEVPMTPTFNNVNLEANHSTDIHQIDSQLQWNNGGVNFNAWVLDVTDFDSGSASLLLNMLVNTSSKFSIHKSGNVVTAGSITATGAITGSNLSGTNTGNQNLFSTIAVSGQSNVVADSTTDTLTLAAGSGIAITTNAGTDTITIATSGVPTASFTTIAVSGQSNVVADSATDTLTLAAGSGIAITTNAGSDTVTIAASGLPTSAFTTIAVSGQSNVVADSASDTLTLAAGSNVTITTDASTDTVTISASADAENNVTIETSGHSLTAGDVGKPVYFSPVDDSADVWDDTASDTYPSGVLAVTPVGDDLELATISHPVTFSQDLLSTTDIASVGRWFYWDADYLEDSDVSDVEAGLWVPDPPLDSWKQICIEVLSISGGNVYAVVHAPF